MKKSSARFSLITVYGYIKLKPSRYVFETEQTIIVKSEVYEILPSVLFTSADTLEVLLFGLTM